MQIAITLITLGFLFFLLSKAADLTITNIRIIGKSLGIHVFFLGMVLGVFTSLPETMLGINAVINNYPTMALGNFLGGTMVLFGLVMPISMIMNQRIKTESWSAMATTCLCLIMPLILLIDGRLGSLDGLVLIASYLSVVAILYNQHKRRLDISLEINVEKHNLKHLGMTLGGILLIMLLSNLIIRFSILLLNELPISSFVVGILIFAVGTNLPELIVAIRAWKKNSQELSMGNITGSAMANVLLIGIFAMVRDFQRPADISYITLAFSLIAILAVYLIAYRTGRELSRTEGIVILSVYAVYLLIEILFLAPKLI